ncbi:MAG: hypothetical protein RBR38_10000 [Desulfomicrobium apsheronum]|nr:hypothetical protein [Desulfomicrobium apsheronum]
MVSLTKNTLEFSFPDVSSLAHCSIEFQRTLRIPDDNRKYPLPPGLGAFPLLHVEDYAKTAPATWRERGGVFLPMYQAEALWINFQGYYPCAVKIAAGKINAITGESWRNELSAKPQDYVVIPKQPWLDGFSVGKGLIRQFVAMPLGQGFTAEEQLTGKADIGGIQISVFPMKKEVHQKLFPPVEDSGIRFCLNQSVCEESATMGLAPGGLVHQEIFEDEYGIEVWDATEMARCFVHLANSEQYLDITGHVPPTEPPTAKQYTNAGMPWFDYYAADQKALQGAKALAELDSIAAKVVKYGKKFLKGNDPVNPTRIVSLGQKGRVSDGQW